MLVGFFIKDGFCQRDMDQIGFESSKLLPGLLDQLHGNFPAFDPEQRPLLYRNGINDKAFVWEVVLRQAAWRVGPGFGGAVVEDTPDAGYWTSEVLAKILSVALLPYSSVGAWLLWLFESSVRPDR